MMTSNAFLLAAVLIGCASAAHAGQTPATSPPTTASAEVMQCAQAQMVVDRLLSTADSRLETARQTNSAADMRAAVDALQTTLRDLRAQLAPCASVQPVGDAHAGHMTPSAATTPAAPSAPAVKPAATAPAITKPAPATRPPTKPSPLPDPHAGHTPTQEPPASTAKKQTETTDPVCGLKVDPKTAPNAQHQGRTYYFCTDQHRQLFSKNPAKYLPRQR